MKLEYIFWEPVTNCINNVVLLYVLHCVIVSYTFLAALVALFYLIWWLIATHTSVSLAIACQVELVTMDKFRRLCCLVSQ